MKWVIGLWLTACLGGLAGTARAAEAGPPVGWPAYLQDFKLPPGRTWAQYRVRAKDGMPQALVPAGEFLLGSTAGQMEAAYRFGLTFNPNFQRSWVANQGPQKRVYLSEFWIDLHDVTNEQYCRCLNELRPSNADRRAWVSLAGELENALQAPQIRPDGDRFVPVAGVELYPVIYVTWAGARAYARWVAGELPSEAQWEKAARAGRDDIDFVWGNAWPPPSRAGNFLDESLKTSYPAAPWYLAGYDDGYATTSPVTAFTPTGYGLYDMAGNVWQLCRDAYDVAWYAQAPDRDPVNTAPANVPTIRGGGWFNRPANLRLAYRGSAFGNPLDQGNRGDRGYDTGFRCVGAP